MNASSRTPTNPNKPDNISASPDRISDNPHNAPVRIEPTHPAKLESNVKNASQ
jgi:hypothetical protein